MHCEICGRPVPKDPVAVRIEGTLMKTCVPCSRLGEKVVERSRGRRATERPVWKERILEPVEGYARLIREGRERMRLTQEQLGARIGVKSSVISRIESGQMKPDMKIGRKLERLFNITLFEEIES